MFQLCVGLGGASRFAQPKLFVSRHQHSITAPRSAIELLFICITNSGPSLVLVGLADTLLGYLRLFLGTTVKTT